MFAIVLLDLVFQYIPSRLRTSYSCYPEVSVLWKELASELVSADQG